MVIIMEDTVDVMVKELREFMDSMYESVLGDFGKGKEEQDSEQSKQDSVAQHAVESTGPSSLCDNGGGQEVQSNGLVNKG